MLLFRLCGYVGCPHPDYLRRLLNSKQISEWIAYRRIEPFGSMHDEQLAGIIAAKIHNANRAPGQAALTEFDFMPNYTEPEMSAEIITLNIAAWKAVADANR